MEKKPKKQSIKELFERAIVALEENQRLMRVSPMWRPPTQSQFSC